MKRFSPRDTALMLAPVSLLGAFGYLLSARKPAVVTPVAIGPFQPYVSRVQVLPATPAEVFDGYDTRVIVEFDAHGRKPVWWDKGFGSYYSLDQGQLVRTKGTTTTSLKRTGYFDSPHLDPKTKRWTTTYRLKLREFPSHVGQIRLRDKIGFTNQSSSASKSVPKVWLDAPLRDDGKTTKIPVASHVTGVKIEKVSIDSAPPAESHDWVERWRAKWVLFKKIPRAGAEQAFDSINMDIAIVNRHGQKVGSVGTSSYSSEELNSDFVQYNPNTDPRRRFANEDYSLDSSATTPKNEPLWLKGTIKSGESWPLEVKVPLRDATGKMLFPPRTQTVPFQVASISKVAPTKEEVTEHGADTTVSLLLSAWNSKADVSKWKWETNYSQRLDTAKAGTFWELPYKPIKQGILFTYDWKTNKTLLEIRYPLILAAIPPTAGKVVLRTDIAANHSRRLPIEITLRP